MFSLRDADRIRVDKGIQKSMSDPISKVEMAFKKDENDTILREDDTTIRLEYLLEQLKQNSITVTDIKNCKYLLPCGKCDKTDLLCSQYER